MLFQVSSLSIAPIYTTMRLAVDMHQYNVVQRLWCALIRLVSLTRRN